MRLNINEWLYAIAAAVIPIILTGGIHMDGLADSADALASWGSPEKKRAILRDPHIGTFGVLAMILYMLVMIVLFQQLLEILMILTNNTVSFRKPALLLGSIFVLSRVMTQIAIAWIPPSAEEGMLFRLSSQTHLRKLGVTGITVMLAGQILWYLEAGAPSLLLLPGMALHLLMYRRKVLRHFGGLSGDLCGRLIQISELWMIAFLCVLMVAGKVWMSPVEVFGWFS